MCEKIPTVQVIHLVALDDARDQAKDKKPRKLFGELTNVVTGQHGEVVDISQDTFGRKMRRERRASSSLPGKDPLTWTDFKEMLPLTSRGTPKWGGLLKAHIVNPTKSILLRGGLQRCLGRGNVSSTSLASSSTSLRMDGQSVCSLSQQSSRILASEVGRSWILTIS